MLVQQNKTNIKKNIYTTPKLNIYNDMGDLLALDPPTPGFEKQPKTNNHND